MWYLMNVDDGVVEKADTKYEIMLSHSHAYLEGVSLGKTFYKVEDENRDYYLFSSKEQAIANGFDWAFADDIPLEPEMDGVTHINVYSRGMTELGRIMSNFYDEPIDTPDGHFPSVETYWHWMGLKDEKDRERVKYMAGWQSNRYATPIKREQGMRVDEHFHEKIKNATLQKGRRHLDLFAKLPLSLPFVHYCIMYGRVIDKTESSQQLIEICNMLRQEAKRMN